jgi:nucleotide-binding universal stress UspA family protein
MFKTILVHVDVDDPGSSDRIQCAAQLAEASRGALVGMAARMPPPAVEVIAAGGAVVAGGMEQPATGELDEVFQRARGEFHRWVSGFPIKTTWRTAVDFPAAALAAAAAAADLVVVGRRNGSAVGEGYASVDLGDLVMRGGRPVLIVPANVSRLALTDGVVVAWKNTREARRALADALPVLAAAASVTLVHVRERAGDEAEGLSDAIGFLDGHQIGATTKTIEAPGHGVAAAVVDYATRAAAGLIVAGAYGHTRVREWAFGGATHDLLMGCPLPLLLSR